MAHRTPDWLLERIALGELPPEELAAARARLASEPEGLERLARLESDDGATRAKLPPSEVAAEVARRRRGVEASRSVRAASPPRRWLPAVALGLPVTVGLVLLMVLSQRELPEEPHSPQAAVLLDTTRTKGLEPKLLIHRQTQGEPEVLGDSARAARGDVLQLSYVSAGRRYGAVLSVDGRGSVTLHFPESPEGSPELRGGTVSLPSAYELDDAPAFERFFFVTSDAPFDVRTVLESARQLAQEPERARNAPLPLPEPLSQTSLTLEK
jgi:hypothetical protein